MKLALKVMAWIFFALDAALLLFFLCWILVASTRDGEQASAIVFSLVAGAFVAVGGAGLALSSRRSWSLGIGCAGLVLGLPPLVLLGIWISNLLGY